MAFEGIGATETGVDSAFGFKFFVVPVDWAVFVLVVAGRIAAGATEVGAVDAAALVQPLLF